MADRTSAEIFGKIFNRLLVIYNDKNTSKDTKEFIWDFSGELLDMTKGYDFDLYQMDCEKALDRFDLGDLPDVVDLELSDPDSNDGDEDLSIKTVDFIRR